MADVVITASPSPINTRQKSMSGTVTIIPPLSVKVGENHICKPHAKAPRTTDSHEAVNTPMKKRLPLVEFQLSFRL